MKRRDAVMTAICAHRDRLGEALCRREATVDEWARFAAACMFIGILRAKLKALEDEA